MKVLINGILGAMGQEVSKLVLSGARGTSMAGGVDANAQASNQNDVGAIVVNKISEAPDADCIIDFSHHSATKELTEYAVGKKCPLVIATTGQTEDEKEMIFKAAEQIPVFFASNYSLGVALLAELAKKVAVAMPDAEIEIVEMHHNRKLDAPSGTALTLAKEITSVRNGANVIIGDRNGKRNPTDIGIQSVRMGNIVGIHEIMIGTSNQTITLKHEAHSRALFAEGAIAAAAFTVNQAPGLYGMNDLVK